MAARNPKYRVTDPDCSNCGRVKRRIGKAPNSQALVCKTCDAPDPELIIGSKKFSRPTLK